MDVSCRNNPGAGIMALIPLAELAAQHSDSLGEIRCRGPIRMICGSARSKRLDRVLRAVRWRSTLMSARVRSSIGCGAGARLEARRRNQAAASVSRLEKHAKWFLNLIAARPDLTLDEVVVAKNAAGIPGSRSAVGRFFLRHNISFKKKPVRCRATASGRGPCALTLDSRAGFA